MIIVAVSLATAIGGWHMGRLQSYGLAATAAVLALIPCTPAWMISLPMGIWALVVLSDPKVRAAFGAASAAPPQHLPVRSFQLGGGHAAPLAGHSLGALAIASTLMILLCGGVLVALLIPAAQMSREAARRAASMNSLKQIGLALANYHDVYNSFPPGVVTDNAGNPLYSGRVLLLPFLAQQNLYHALDLNEPWDSPRNRRLTEMSLPIFMDPSDPSNKPGRSNYLFVTGKGTLFEDGRAGNPAISLTARRTRYPSLKSAAALRAGPSPTSSTSPLRSRSRKAITPALTSSPSLTAPSARFPIAPAPWTFARSPRSPAANSPASRVLPGHPHRFKSPRQPPSRHRWLPRQAQSLRRKRRHPPRRQHHQRPRSLNPEP